MTAACWKANTQPARTQRNVKDCPRGGCNCDRRPRLMFQWKRWDSCVPISFGRPGDGCFRVAKAPSVAGALRSARFGPRGAPGRRCGCPTLRFRLSESTLLCFFAISIRLGNAMQTCVGKVFLHPHAGSVLRCFERRTALCLALARLAEALGLGSVAPDPNRSYRSSRSLRPNSPRPLESSVLSNSAISAGRGPGSAEQARQGSVAGGEQLLRGRFARLANWVLAMQASAVGSRNTKGSI
ncbi:hypothetical protein Pla175_23080 [Pirellulimonas nuda]|uniref:Uncharacterized protein n=1 Tax=Pirellulimonas nuda TaxID=2528009 RepID=A0A518DBR3_9BACT|nr:hypothetical protein Pla175_23080 [Pirellulimonas nuda]